MANTAMSADKFWALVDVNAQSGNDHEDPITNLRISLRALSTQELMSFENAFRRHLTISYSWDLWGAAYIIHGGCSDDGFDYFRCWLISRGRAAYEAAMKDPDSLAQLALEPLGPGGVWEFEEYSYIAGEIFQEKDGDGDIMDHWDNEGNQLSSEPSGQAFEDDEDHLSKRYPKLWKRFGNDPLG